MQSTFMENFLLLCVIFNTCVLAMDGLFTEDEDIEMLSNLNMVFTIIFIIEMGLKIIGFGIKGIFLSVVYIIKGYVSDKMNLFDGLIVLLSITELVMPSSTTGSSST